MYSNRSFVKIGDERKRVRVFRSCARCTSWTRVGVTLLLLALLCADMSSLSLSYTLSYFILLFKKYNFCETNTLAR